MTHTPGPWAERRIGPRLSPVRLTDKTRIIVPLSGPAFAYLPEGREEIQAANARLIAAAPEMLAFVQRFAHLTDGEAWELPAENIIQEAELARALLARIKGGS